MDFIELVSAAGRNKDHEADRILCFDPGHTTGWAFFEKALLVDAGELDTTSIEACILNTGYLFESYPPDIVVIEDYRIYKWRQKQHVGSEMLTTRIIGCLETLTIQNFSYRGWVHKIVKQPAHVAKGFCTDKKLKEWEMDKPGMRHARDAIRHGCYFILFGAIRPEDKHGGVTVG